MNYRLLLLLCFPHCLGLVVLVNALEVSHPQLLDTQSIGFNWAYLVIALCPALILLARQGFPLALFGVSRAGLQRAVTEGLLISAAVIGLVLALWRWQDDIGHGAAQIPNLRLDPMHFQYVSGSFLYLIHVALQEFLVRGFQTTLHKVLNEPAGHISVSAAALMFALFHLHLGPLIALLAFVLSIALGYLYLRHRNLAGTILVHFVVGVVALSVHA